jgi:hypothetical protein
MYSYSGKLSKIVINKCDSNNDGKKKKNETHHQTQYHIFKFKVHKIGQHDSDLNGRQYERHSNCESSQMHLYDKDGKCGKTEQNKKYCPVQCVARNMGVVVLHQVRSFKIFDFGFWILDSVTEPGLP